jgi:hypothetical protein
MSINIVEALMLTKNLSIRRMNRNAPATCEPEYRPTFFAGEGETRTVEQAAMIIGRKTLKRYLMDKTYQSAAEADAIIQQLDDQRSVEVANLQLSKEEVAGLGLYVNKFVTQA